MTEEVPIESLPAVDAVVDPPSLKAMVEALPAVDVPASVPAVALIPTKRPVGRPRTSDKVRVYPSPLELEWKKILIRYEKRLRKEGRTRGGFARYVGAANKFVAWACINDVTPTTATEDHKLKYGNHTESLGHAKIVRYMNRAAGHGMIDEAIMAQNGQPDETEVENEADEYVEEEVEEAPPPKSRRAVPVAPQVVYVTAPQAAPKTRAPAYPRAAARTAAQRLLPKNDKLRVFKRGAGGKRLYINDYTVEDIGGGSLHKFIKDYIDVEFGDPNGLTTYEVCEVGADDKEKGPGTPITIESTARQPQDETLSQARDAVALVQELRSMEEERVTKSHELLDEAKKKAVGSNDMNSLMMLMMMQNMQHGPPRNDGDMVLRIVEKLRGNTPHAVSPLGDLVPIPPAPVHLTPSPESTLGPVVNQLLAAQLAPRMERSVVDLAKEMAVIKELFAPPPQRDPEMVAVLKLLAERMAPAAAPAAGIETMVGTFNKMREMVTTLAPQMNAGGLTGALQSIITPELGKALGNVIASGIGKTAAPPPSPSAPAPVPTPPAQPDIVRARVAALREASVEQLQIQRTVDLLQEMYAVPAYTSKLDPALKALLISDVKPAQAVLAELLKEVRPDLVNASFVNKVIVALVVSAGGTPPAELISPTTPVVKVEETPVAKVEEVPHPVTVEAEVKSPAPATTSAEVKAVTEVETTVTETPVFANGREGPNGAIYPPSASAEENVAAAVA